MLHCYTVGFIYIVYVTFILHQHFQLANMEKHTQKGSHVNNKSQIKSSKNPYSP